MNIQLSKTNINLTFAAHPPYIPYGFERTGRTLSIQANRGQFEFVFKGIITIQVDSVF